MKEYKVVKIIDSKTIIINAGFKDNISTGDEFKIYCIGATIFDPETNEELGSLKVTKDIVYTYEVMEKMCMCKKKKLKNNALQYGNDLLNVDPNDITGGLITEEPIRIGDKVEKITPELPF